MAAFDRVLLVCADARPGLVAWAVDETLSCIEHRTRLRSNVLTLRPDPYVPPPRAPIYDSILRAMDEGWGCALDCDRAAQLGKRVNRPDLVEAAMKRGGGTKRTKM